MYLVPLVLVVTSGDKQRRVEVLTAHPLAGPDGGRGTVCAGDHMNSMCPRTDFLLEKRYQRGEALSSSTLVQTHSTLSKPDSQLSTSLFHYCGPVGPWERHGEMHILERYRSRQFGGSSALNHCSLSRGRSSLTLQRNTIKTMAFDFEGKDPQNRNLFVSHWVEQLS